LQKRPAGLRGVESACREAGDVLATPLFPGFSLALAELFA
jgi:hypothetical protein